MKALFATEDESNRHMLHCYSILATSKYIQQQQKKKAEIVESERSRTFNSIVRFDIFI